MPMDYIPVIASVEDLDQAVAHAEDNEPSRWYVMRRAVQLHADEKIPEHWLTTMVAAFTGDREAEAEKGNALPDGSFPIPNKEFLRRAVRAFGRAKNKSRAKRHIIKRAKELGAVSMLPDDWGVTAAAPLAASAGASEEQPLTLQDTLEGLSLSLESFSSAELEFEPLIASVRDCVDVAIEFGFVDEFAERGDALLVELAAQGRMDDAEANDVREALTAAIRRVATPEGEAFYGQPIGSIIVPNVYLPSVRKMVTDVKTGDYFSFAPNGEKYKATQDAKVGISEVKIHAVVEGRQDAQPTEMTMKTNQPVQTYRVAPKGAKALLSKPDESRVSDQAGPKSARLDSPVGRGQSMPDFMYEPERDRRAPEPAVGERAAEPEVEASIGDQLNAANARIKAAEVEREKYKGGTDERKAAQEKFREAYRAKQSLISDLEDAGNGHLIPDDGKTIRVRTKAQKVLLEDELKGQISDGMWENSSPDWQDWSDATVIVDPDHPGRNWMARKDNYQLNSKNLLDIVGDRMLENVQEKVDSGFTDAQMRKELTDLRRIFKTRRQPRTADEISSEERERVRSSKSEAANTAEVAKIQAKTAPAAPPTETPTAPKGWKDDSFNATPIQLEDGSFGADQGWRTGTFRSPGGEGPFKYMSGVNRRAAVSPDGRVMIVQTGDRGSGDLYNAEMFVFKDGKWTKAPGQIWRKADVVEALKRQGIKAGPNVSVGGFRGNEPAFKPSRPTTRITDETFAAQDEAADAAAARARAKRAAAPGTKITSEAQLDAMPAGTVVHNSIGARFTKQSNGEWHSNTGKPIQPRTIRIMDSKVVEPDTPIGTPTGQTAAERDAAYHRGDLAKARARETGRPAQGPNGVWYDSQGGEHRSLRDAQEANAGTGAAPFRGDLDIPVNGGKINPAAKGNDPERFKPKVSLGDGSTPAAGDRVRDKNGRTGVISETYQAYTAVKWDDTGKTQTVKNNKLNKASAGSAPERPSPSEAAGTGKEKTTRTVDSGAKVDTGGEAKTAEFKVGDEVMTPLGRGRITNPGGGTKEDPAWGVEMESGLGTPFFSSELRPVGSTQKTAKELAESGVTGKELRDALRRENPSMGNAQIHVVAKSMETRAAAAPSAGAPTGGLNTLEESRLRRMLQPRFKSTGRAALLRKASDEQLQSFMRSAWSRYLTSPLDQGPHLAAANAVEKELRRRGLTPDKTGSTLPPGT